MKFLSELSGNRQIFFNELKVSQYKELLKCSFGDEPDLKIFLQTFLELLEEITNTPLNVLKQKLTIIDIFCLLIDMRTYALDNVCKVTIKDEEDKRVNIDLHLEYIREELQEMQLILERNFITEDSLQINFSFPSIERLLEKTDDHCLLFLKELLATNKEGKIITLQLETNEQAKLLLEKVAPFTYVSVYKQFAALLASIKQHNFLERYNLEQKLSFVPNLESFLWFTKLIFSESLLDFYKNLFYLSYYGHMNTEYIEKCTVGEYRLFSSELQGAINPKKQEGEFSNSNEEDFGDDGFFENEV